MKTKNFLSRFSAAALLAAALIPAALTSCSSDSEPTPAPDPIPEGMAQINLSFATPAMGVETRAGNISDNDQNIAADADEANIKSLWLYIFKQDAENTNNYTLSYAFDCTNRIGGATDVLEYRPVALGAASGSSYVEGLAVTPGTYRFFMVANLESYLSTTDASKYTPAVSGVVTDALENVTISDIQNLALSMYENNSIKLKTTDLPMGMDYNEVQLKSGSSATLSNGDVTITSGSTSIVCDMTFLCSAVRYTFIYDKDDFSWNYSKFDFTSLKLNNIVDGYKFTEKKELGTAANNQNVDITGKKCSIDNIDTFIAKPSNLTASDSQTWATDAKHAYQGIVYLPSNYTLTEGNKTTMKLTCDLGETDNKVYDIVLPNTNTTNEDANRLSKGNFYDVIGKVSASGMEFFVTVRQWKKGDRQVIDF